MLKALGHRYPTLRIVRFEDLSWERARDDPSDFCERTRRTCRQDLHSNVTQRCSFYRTCHHAPSGCVGGKLVQQSISGAATHNVDFGKRLSGDPFQ